MRRHGMLIKRWRCSRMDQQVSRMDDFSHDNGCSVACCVWMSLGWKVHEYTLLRMNLGAFQRQFCKVVEKWHQAYKCYKDNMIIVVFLLFFWVLRFAYWRNVMQDWLRSVWKIKTSSKLLIYLCAYDTLLRSTTKGIPYMMTGTSLLWWDVWCNMQTLYWDIAMIMGVNAFTKTLCYDGNCHVIVDAYHHGDKLWFWHG